MSMYDIIFIGGGPAGYEGAIMAGKLGMKTVVIERDQVGGTCLQRGCIPTKTILHSVKLIKEIQNSSKLGIDVDGFRFSYPAILNRKNRVVSKLTRGIELQFKQNGVELVRGHAILAGENRVLVNQREWNARYLVIATGTVPADLPILRFDGKRILSSDDLLQLEQIPDHLIVIGAGAVGIEWALIFHYLGAKVTLLEIMPQVLPGTDGEIAEILKKELIKQDIAVHTGATIIRAETHSEKNIVASIKKADQEWQEQASHILVAVGRKPNTSDWPLASLGIETDSKGFIKVNANLQSGCPSIYACGDAIGPPLLAHKASHQALAIVDLLTSGKPMRHQAIPAAVFSFPEMASVGVTTEEAQSQGFRIKIGRFPYSVGSRANAVGEITGLIKIIADEQNKLLGAHIIGAEAGELIPLMTWGINKGMKADEWKDLIFIHPTLSEGIWEALGEIAGFSIHI